MSIDSASGLTGHRAATTDLDIATATPVRAAHPSARPGEHTLLRDVGSTYRDGAEDDLLGIVRGSDDLGSLNEDLHRRASTWAERYHLDRQRANVLRAFDLSGAGRVLEVGAGCGAMSRYLAEVCPVVDALEPVPARAAVAAARLRDLPGARVFTGELADLPDTPSYDLIVVIGVLEYVGSGTADAEPYLSFLSEIRRRLLPGGRLLLAIENKLGVKYLAGAPEDHSDRAYDSIEDYPIGAPARTFDRAALGRLFEGAGFTPTFFSAFPDYKLTRVVMADGLMTHPTGLAAQLPRFPSPDWQSPRDFGPNEELLWRTLVAAGLGAEHGNSFVVVAGTDGPADDLWPAERQAAFFTTERRPGRATETRVERADGGLVVHRRILGGRRDADGPTHRVGSGPVLPGRPLVDVIAQGDLELTARTLTRWRAMVAESAQDPDGVAVDLVPHNLLLDDDGGLTFIDDEWRSTEWTADDVVTRGLVWLSERLSSTPSQWRDRPSREAVLAELSALIGFPLEAAGVTRVLHLEAVLQTEIMRRGRTQEGFAEEVARTEAELTGLLDHPMTATRPKLGPLLAELHQLHEAQGAFHEREQALRAELGGLQNQLTAVTEELTSIHNSFGHRLLVRYHRLTEKLAPLGSRRREAYRRAGDSLRRRRP